MDQVNYLAIIGKLTVEKQILQEQLELVAREYNRLKEKEAEEGEETE